jgi:hypothetical protein
MGEKRNAGQGFVGKTRRIETTRMTIGEEY